MPRPINVDSRSSLTMTKSTDWRGYVKIENMRAGDFNTWLELAREVGPTFRAPKMHESEDFITYARRKIAQGNALKAVNPDGAVMGIIGFSTSFNRITWLGVFSTHRRQGVGEALLGCAVEVLDSTRPITVETYPGDYEPGRPARALYAKVGFLTTGEEGLLDDLGNPIEKLERRVPSEG